MNKKKINKRVIMYDMIRKWQKSGVSQTAFDVEPYAWLKKVLEVIPDYKVNKLHELLPGNL